MATNPFAEFAVSSDSNPFAEFVTKPTAATVKQPETGIPGPRQPGFLETLVNRPLDVLEVPIAVGANIATGLPIYLSSAFGPEVQQKVARNIQYQPRGQMAQDVLESMAAAADVAKIPPYMGTIGPGVASLPTKAGVRTKAASFTAPSEAKFANMVAEDYARGPQIEAAADAQRMGIVLRPTDIQPTLGPKITEIVAGEKGGKAAVAANKTQVRKVQLADMGMPDTAPLNKTETFNAARAKVAGPYDEIAQLPTMTADKTTLDSLQSVRKTQDLIGTKEYASAIDDLVNDAVAKTQAGMNGAQVADAVSVLRSDAKKVYNSKSASLADQHVADARLAIANALENMVDSNVRDPKLLDRWRDARQKMARIYAYEGATDLNTGLLDVKKLSRITSKDNALTGDIAALGRVAGNFPHAFEVKPTSSWLKQGAIELGRATPPGAAGLLAGYELTGGYEGALYGSILGALAGKAGQKYAANKLASPQYQAGLQLRDLRTPVNNLAQPIPQSQAIVPYQPEVVGPSGTSDVNKLRIVSYDENGVPIYAGEARGPGFTMPSQPHFGAAPTPYAQRALPNEVPRQVYEAQKRAELAQEFKATAERKPTSGEVVLDYDPITGRLREASQGVKGATPETFSNFGSALETASSKVTSGQRFNLTAAEKVAWDKTRVDLAEVAPGFKSLTDKAIAEKMLDRAWVQETAAKAREKAAAFESLAARAADERARQTALANRERMLSLAEDMEEQIGKPRPVRGTQQGPKTRAAVRNKLAPRIELNNMLAPD